MATGDPGARRVRHPLVPDATARRPAAPQVAAVGLVTAVTVSAAGGGNVTWLCVPAALLAAAECRTRLGSAIGAAVVIVLSATPVLLWAATGPSIALVLLVAAACAGVLVGARERSERERDQLRDFALTDPVTGIANRRSLLIRADYEIARHSRAQHSFALVMLDLDGFKLLNDRFGHAAGDDLLRDVATALSRAMRAQDTVARFGGDEFCVLAPETDERGTARLATRVTQAVRDVSAGLDAVAGSVGIAVFPGDGVSAADLMHAADVRLLAAKRNRGGRGQRRHAA